MKLQAQEIQQKVQELLLNKVKNLEWTYFDLNLNEAFKDFDLDTPIDAIEKFFDAIHSSVLGKYEFKGQVNEEDILKVLFSIINENPKILKSVLFRLFDINEISNKSGSDEGNLGKFNKKDQELRNKIYKDKIRKGHRAKDGNIVVLAEGDSWFQFPRVYLKIDPVKDIIDWLIDDKKYAVYSLAAGGDWLSNIFYTGDYIEELPKVSPDVFLISGGGNDLVGGNRLATMVINPRLDKKRNLDEEGPIKRLIQKRTSHNDLDMVKYKRGLELISDEFFTFLNLYFTQYFVFLYSLANVDKYKNMLMITQGYDYALPNNENRGNFLSMQRIVNEFTDTGHWLFQPLNMKGVTNKDDQEAVLYTMIYEFNEMLIQLAEFEGLPNLFHIDSRGYANEKDWFDELHLKSDAFKDISKVYKFCITQNLFHLGKQKVYKVKDIINRT